MERGRVRSIVGVGDALREVGALIILLLFLALVLGWGWLADSGLALEEDEYEWRRP